MTTSTAPDPTTPSKGLNIALWVGQVLLAAMFGMAGLTKLLTPIVDLAEMLPWALELPSLVVRFIGLSELAGAVGLIAPALSRIKPSLTPLAAAGLCTVMLLAALFHFSRGEMSSIGINLILGAIAFFVAWGRFRKAPIMPRS